VCHKGRGLIEETGESERRRAGSRRALAYNPLTPSIHECRPSHHPKPLHVRTMPPFSPSLRSLCGAQPESSSISSAAKRA
jgi:hypothetical protein